MRYFFTRRFSLSERVERVCVTEINCTTRTSERHSFKAENSGQKSNITRFVHFDEAKRDLLVRTVIDSNVSVTLLPSREIVPDPF